MKILSVLIVCIIVILAIYAVTKSVSKNIPHDVPAINETSSAQQQVQQNQAITQQTPINSQQNKMTVISPTLTAAEATWKIATQQVIEWDTSNLSEGNYTVVVQLVSLSTNQVIGDIGSIKAVDGKQSISYKVGTVLVGGDAQQQLPEGQYKIKLSLYKTPVGGGALGYGEYIESVYGNSVRVLK